MQSNYVVLNFTESVIFFSVAAWVLGFIIATAISRRPQYLRLTNQTLTPLWRRSWKYIVIFSLGYFLAIEKIVQLSIHF